MAGCVWWSVLRAVYGSVVAWLFLPLMLILLMSVTDSPVVGLPIEHVTAHWYGAALADKDVRSAFLYSCTIAAASTTLALLVGLWTALAIDALHSTILRVAFIAAACLPIVTPGIVSAISLRMFILTIGIDPGYVAITLGHAIHATPFVIIVLAGRLRTVPPEQIEAARILGAGPVRAFLRVTLPWLYPAVAGAAVLALLESFDDFLRSFFLGGYQPTLPVLLYGRLFSGLSPEINAIASIVLLMTISVGLAGERLARQPRLI